MSASITFAPSIRKRLAIARPIPCAAPVTTAILFSRRISLLLKKGNHHPLAAGGESASSFRLRVPGGFEGLGDLVEDDGIVDRRRDLVVLGVGDRPHRAAQD